jgi:hypothetical protein
MSAKKGQKNNVETRKNDSMNELDEVRCYYFFCRLAYNSSEITSSAFFEI